MDLDLKLGIVDSDWTSVFFVSGCKPYGKYSLTIINIHDYQDHIQILLFEIDTMGFCHTEKFLQFAFGDATLIPDKSPN